MQPISGLVALALPALAFAQYGGGGSSSLSSATTTAAAATNTASSSGSVHTVTVGANGQLKYVPDVITAKVGDSVEFHFAAAGHSVVEGVKTNACQPSGANAFFSGFPSSGGQPFTITINNTSPIYFYCASPDHCQAGMVGVINDSQDNLNTYTAAAAKSSGSKSPAHVQGGVFGTVSSSSNSGSSSTTTGSSAKSTGAASRLSMGAAGIALPLAFLASRFL